MSGACGCCPARVMVYFVLALAFFEHSSSQAVWDKLGAGLRRVTVSRPGASSLSRARRRVGSAPLHRLFEVLASPMATRTQTGSFYRGLQVVTVDGTTLSIPDEKAVTWRFPKHGGPVLEFGYPLLRLVTLVECGTRALLGASFGPDTTGELSYARGLLHHLDASMVLLAVQRSAAWSVGSPGRSNRGSVGRGGTCARVEAPQVGLPNTVDVCFGGVGARPPRPNRPLGGSAE